MEEGNGEGENSPPLLPKDILTPQPTRHRSLTGAGEEAAVVNLTERGSLSDGQRDEDIAWLGRIVEAIKQIAPPRDKNVASLGRIKRK